MHPGRLRCSSVTYQRYAPSSRLAGWAPSTAIIDRLSHSRALGRGAGFVGRGQSRRSTQQRTQALLDLRARCEPFADHAVQLGLAGRALDDYDQIDARRPQFASRAKCFANQALGATSDDGIADATRSRNAQTRLACVRRRAD